MTSGLKEFYRWKEERQMYGTFYDSKDDPFSLNDLRGKKFQFFTASSIVQSDF